MENLVRGNYLKKWNTAFLLLERPPKIKKKGGDPSNFSKAKFLCLSSLK